MTTFGTDALVTAEWLGAHLRDPDLRVLDGSWHMPQVGRNARAEFLDAHISGAAFFDIDATADTSVALPHMLPSASLFAHAVGRLGVGSGDHVVVYDTRGVYAAARVWWTFRVFGHDRVTVLDGGLPRWLAEGRPVETGEARPMPSVFSASLRPELVRSLAQVRDNLTTRGEQVLDARSRGRFTASEPEPRPGLRGGHIPGSHNLPFDALSRPDGTLRPPDELRGEFEKAGVDLARPIVTSCGSGITAAVLALGLYRVGHRSASVYDGSWTEWGGRDDTPVET